MPHMKRTVVVTHIIWIIILNIMIYRMFVGPTVGSNSAYRGMNLFMKVREGKTSSNNNNNNSNNNNFIRHQGPRL